MKDFFETNSISLEVIDMYDELCLEKAKKTALNFVRRELYEEYRHERETEIIYFMALYWCGIKSGFVDEKSRVELDKITKEEVYRVYNEDDACTVWGILEELLKTEPIKPVRKKIDYSNPGSKNWKVGDLYAYQLSGEDAEKIGYSGKYAILYCYDIHAATRNTNEVTVYAFVGDEYTLKKSPEAILSESMRVMSFTHRRYYQFLLVDPHHKYPKDQLIFVGNTEKFEHAEDEQFPPHDLYKPRLVWKWFDHSIAFNIDTMMEKIFGKKALLDH